MNKNDLLAPKKNKVAIDAKNANLNLSKKRFSGAWKATIFIFIIIIIIGALLSVHFYANKKVNDSLKSALRSIKGDCYVTYESSLYKLWNSSLDITGIVVECNSVTAATIDLFHIAKVVIDESFITDFEAVITNGILKFESPIYGNIGKKARQLGYFNTKFNGNISFKHNNKTELFTMSDLALNFIDLGDIKLSLTVPNISSTNFATSIKEIINNNYRNLNIEFTNTGLTNKILKNYSEHNGYDTIQAKNIVLDAIKLKMYLTEIHRAEYAQIKAIYDFISSANVLTIRSDTGDRSSLATILDSLKSNRYSEVFRSLTKLPMTIEAN